MSFWVKAINFGSRYKGGAQVLPARKCYVPFQLFWDGLSQLNVWACRFSAISLSSSIVPTPLISERFDTCIISNILLVQIETIDAANLFVELGVVFAIHLM